MSYWNCNLGKTLSLTAFSILFFLAGLSQTRTAAEWVWLEDRGYTITSPDQSIVVQRFRRARDLLFKQEYARAIPVLNQVRSETRSLKLFNLASLLRAQALYHSGSYIESYRAFKGLDRQRMEGRFQNLIVQYKIDIGFQLMKGKDHRTFLGLFPILSAESAGERIVRTYMARYPYKSFSDTYQYRLANLYFERGNYHLAAGEYRFLLNQYEQTHWDSHAQFLAGESYFRTVKDISYDISNLSKARDHFRTYVHRYPDAPKVQLAKKRLRKIATMKAKKLYNSADWYDRTGRRSGAISSFKDVVRIYPGTKWGKRALKRLEELNADVSEESRDRVKAVKKPRILRNRLGD